MAWAKVLIVEDCDETGSILAEYLEPWTYERLLRSDDPTRLSAHGRTIRQTVDGEPVSGQLAQFRRGFEYLPDPGERFIEAEVLPAVQLERLVRAAADDDVEAIRAVVSESHISLSKADKDSIMILDLALGADEGPSMDEEEVGARDQVDTISARRALRDPRDRVRALSGFKVLRALGKDMPIIATTYATNPLVLQHCLVNGAFAVVPKPTKNRHVESNFDFATARKKAIVEREESARANECALDVAVTNYAFTVVSEVLKAVAELCIRNAIWGSSLIEASESP